MRGLFLLLILFTSLLNGEVEQTLSIIKPNAVQQKNIGPILISFEENGFTIAAMKMSCLTPLQAEAFYEEHRNRPFYRDVVSFMTSGPVVLIVLEGENIIESYRELMGATNPDKARRGSLRARFGKSIEANAVHGSESKEAAEKEIALFFSPREIHSVNKQLPMRGRCIK